MRRTLFAGAVVVTLLAGPVVDASATRPPDAPQIDPAGGGGHVDHHPYDGLGATGLNDYLVYVPSGWKAKDELPLYVMVHGCGTTAEQQMQANLLNPIAD